MKERTLSALIVSCLAVVVGWQINALSATRDLTTPFIENRGQLPGDIRYYATIRNGYCGITNDGRLIYSLADSENRYLLSEHFVSARDIHVNGESLAVTRVNYLKGSPARHSTDIPTYNSVGFGEIYDGIELRLGRSENNVEKVFVVKPFADPGASWRNFKEFWL